MGGRGAKGAMASEVVSASGVSVSGGSINGLSSKAATIKPLNPTKRLERTHKPLSAYQSIYTDKPEYQDFIKEAEEGYIKTLTDAQRESLGYYKGSGYQAINRPLREGTMPTKSNMEHINNLDSVLSKTTLGKDLVVYRGFSASFTHEVGKSYTDKAYMSTSLNPHRAFGGNIVLKIHAPATTKGAFIEPQRIYNKKAAKGSLSGYMEHEILLARGTTYTVVKKSKILHKGLEKDLIHVVIDS